MTHFLKKNNFIFYLIIFTTIICLINLKDFGIGIEEHFQRKSGFYWLNYLLNFSNFDILKKEVFLKINEINEFTPNLFPIEKVPYYGVLFDLPMALIEIIFSIKEPVDYFLLRHFVIILIFLISSYFFYKLIFLKFRNYSLALFGFLIYVYMPRVYGNIFFDNKDIFFLSIFTITIYFLTKYLKFNKTTDLIFFSIFCAFSTSTRIIGIFLPLSFIVFLFFKTLDDNYYKKNFKILFLFAFIYIFTLFLHWPYLWTLNLSEFLNFFTPFFQAMNPIVFFGGEFYQSKYLPLYYLPKWIFISTPIYILFFFLVGLLIQIRRLFFRYLNIDKNMKKKNGCLLWKSDNEKIDFFIFVNFLIIFLMYLSVSLPLLSGWRHFYFLNFFLSYYFLYALFYIFIYIRNKKFLKINLKFLLLVFFIINVFKLYLYHPFQSAYFNLFAKKNNYEIDTQSLSRVDAIKEILKDNKDSIIVGTASWTPLEDARSLIERKYWSKLVFLGTSNLSKADYIYSNHYYEINFNLNNKYEIPKNFVVYKQYKVDNTRIYTIYKKIN